MVGGREGSDGGREGGSGGGREGENGGSIEESGTLYQTSVGRICPESKLCLHTATAHPQP